MLRDDVLSMSVCHFQCQALSSTCTTIQIYCDATWCRLVKSYERSEGQCLHLQRDLYKKSAWTALARLFDLEDEGTTSLLNVGTHLTVYTAKHTRLRSSSALLWQPQNSHAYSLGQPISTHKYLPYHVYVYTKQVEKRDNTSLWLVLGGVRFESRISDRLLWLRTFMIFLGPSGICRHSISNYTTNSSTHVSN